MEAGFGLPLLLVRAAPLRQLPKQGFIFYGFEFVIRLASDGCADPSPALVLLEPESRLDLKRAAAGWRQRRAPVATLAHE